MTLNAEYRDKEEHLTAELANQVLAATNRNLVVWELGDPRGLQVALSCGYGLLLSGNETAGTVTTYFRAYSDDHELLGQVRDGHPDLKYNLADCYRRLSDKLDPRWSEHQRRVAALTAMCQSVPVADPPAATDFLPTAEEDEVDELHAEDAEVAFQDDMAEQAAEFAKEAQEEEADETLASLPGQAVSPSPASEQPRTKKIIRRVLKRPGPSGPPGLFGPPPPPPPPPPPGKSRVLDTSR